MALSLMYSLQKSACFLLKKLSRDFTSSDCLSHSRKVYISRQSVKISFLMTNLRSSPEGMTLLKADGKTSLPLSSTLTVYSPMNVVIFICSYMLQK